MSIKFWDRKCKLMAFLRFTNFPQYKFKTRSTHIHKTWFFTHKQRNGILGNMIQERQKGRQKTRISMSKVPKTHAVLVFLDESKMMMVTLGLLLLAAPPLSSSPLALQPRGPQLSRSSQTLSRPVLSFSFKSPQPVGFFSFSFAVFCLPPTLSLSSWVSPVALLLLLTQTSPIFLAVNSPLIPKTLAQFFFRPVDALQKIPPLVQIFLPFSP